MELSPHLSLGINIEFVNMNYNAIINLKAI